MNFGVFCFWEMAASFRIYPFVMEWLIIIADSITEMPDSMSVKWAKSTKNGKNVVLYPPSEKTLQIAQIMVSFIKNVRAHLRFLYGNVITIWH